MKRNPFQNVISFIVKYIWIFCTALITLELFSTMFSATSLLAQTSKEVLQSQAGEIWGRIDGVLRLLNGLAIHKDIGNSTLPIFDRATRTLSFQNSYDLYMLAVLDKDFNVSPADETEPSAEPLNLAGRDYLQRMKETGAYQVTDVIVSGTDGVTKNYTIAVPIFRDGEFDGGILGSIHFEDIDKMLKRENKGTFHLAGHYNTIMSSENKSDEGKTLDKLYAGVWFMGTDIAEINAAMSANQSGNFWIISALGPSYISYCNIGSTDWTLICESRLDLVFPAVIPLFLAKVFIYCLFCWIISKFGRRYLEHQFADISYLLDQVACMQKELFRTEQIDYNGLLDLTQQGLCDQLTGLATRGVLIKRFEQTLEDETASGMLCFLDLDDLKLINDTLGHEIGDHALLHFARVLKRYEEKYHGIAARYGGDEFILTLNGIGKSEGERLAETLCQELSVTLELENSILPIHGSIGIVFYPTNGKTLEELIGKADLALYSAKRNGKNGFAVFESK